MYSFSHASGGSDLFSVDPLTGEITVTGQLDFERSKQHTLIVQVIDRGRLSDTSKVLIDVLDALF